MFDWQDLRYFLAAARLGSLTAAAAELGVDHATVGRRVARLEDSIGAKLVVRLPRSTALTEDGAALAAAADTMVDGAQAIVRHLRGQARGLSGTVTLSALPTLTAFVIAPSLPLLAKRHSGIRLVLSASSAVASLERGEADVAIGYVRPRLAGRVVRRIGQLQFDLYGAPTFASQAPENFSFIGFEESLSDIPQQRWLDSFAAERPFSLRSNDVTTQLQAATAGLGIALLPRFLGAAQSGLVRLDACPQPPSRALWMSVHADVRRSPIVRAVMDHLMSVFARFEH